MTPVQQLLPEKMQKLLFKGVSFIYKIILACLVKVVH